MDRSNVHNLRARSISARLLLVVILIGLSIVVLGPPSAAQGSSRIIPYPVDTSVARQSAEQGTDRRAREIEANILEAAATMTFNPPIGVTPNRVNENPASPWYIVLFQILAHALFQLLEPIAEGTVSYVITLVHNPNIASPYNLTYRMPDGRADIPYDLVTLPVKRGIIQGYVVMQALAINLLLLLFVLSIWKYWVHPHSRHGHQFLGAVGRLIATTGLILFWPVLSFHIVQISNEMIDFVFRSITPGALSQAVKNVLAAAAAGGVGLLGGQALRMVPQPGIEAIGFATRALAGSILSFIFLSVILYESISLIVLKAVQTGLMIAQFMFAPMFLVFFATPDTERVATGFVRSCVEVSLWTFVWAGLLKALIAILSVRPEDSSFGQFIMLLGILQIMLHVPDFMARAQISPMSEFMSPKGFVGGTKSLIDNLIGNGRKLKNWMFEKDDDINPKKQGTGNGNDGDPASGPKLTTGPSGSNQAKPKSKGREDTAQNAAANPPGGQQTPQAGADAGSGQPTTPLPASKSGRNRFARALGKGDKPLADAMSSLASLIDNEQVGESEGDEAKIHTDGKRGVTGITYGKNMSAKERAELFATAALAHELMRNPAMRNALAGSKWYKPSPLSTDPKKDQANFEKGINKDAVRGAEDYLAGKTGSKGAQLLKEAHGEMNPERAEELLESLQDSDNPNSPFNANYKNNRKNVEGAGMKPNAANMAFANSVEGSKLKGAALAAAFNALEQGMRPSMPPGLAPGTDAYNEELGRRIAGSTPDRQKALAAVGISFAGAPAAEQPQTPEEWDAYATHTEKLANSLGVPSDKALGRLRHAMGAGTAVGDNRNMLDRLNSAAAVVAAANEQRVPQQAMQADSPLAQDLYRTAQANGNILTPRQVFSALTAAKLAGANNPLDPIVDEMLNPDTGEWKAGEINEATMALARRSKAAGTGVNKDVCMRVRAAGTAEAHDAVAFAVAARIELENIPPARTANGVAMVTTECMNMARSYYAATGLATPTNAQVVTLAGALASHNASNLTDANEVLYANNNGISGEDVLSYNDVATQGRAAGIHYPVAEVRQARSLAREGYPNGRIGDALVLLHTAVTTSLPGGTYLTPEIAAAGIRHVVDMGYQPASRDNAAVLTTIGTMVAAHDPRLADVDWNAAAEAGVTLFPGSAYTPANIDHLRNLATANGVKASSIGSALYKELEKAYPVGTTNYAGSKAVVRATELYTPAQLSAPANAHVIPTIQYMQNHGWHYSNIDQNAITRTNAMAGQTTVYYTTSAGSGSAAAPAPQPVVINRDLMQRLEAAHIDPGDRVLTHIALRPELSSLRGGELRQACEGIRTYIDAALNPAALAPGAAPVAVTEARVDSIDSALLGAAVALQRTHGVDACRAVHDVEHIADDSSLRNSTVPPRGAFLHTINGARFFVT